MTSRRSPTPARVAFLIGLGAVLVLAHVLFWRCVAPGIGLATDFMPYTLPVHEALAGRPFVMIHHPPLYPLAILLLCQSGNLEPFAAAEVLQWVCHLALPLVAGAVAWWLTSAAVLPSLLAMVTLAASPHVLDLGGQIASEHLFVILTLGALGLLGSHLEAPGGTRWLWASATLAALALLTRYAGLALAGTTILLLLGQRKAWGERLREAAVASAVTLGPLGLQVLRNQLQHDNAVNREFSFKGVPWHKFDHGLQVMMTWWAPQSLVSLPAALVVVLLGGLAWFGMLRRATASSTPPGSRIGLGLRVLGVYSTLYLAFILACMMFADAWIPFDHRILFPVQATTTLALAGALAFVGAGGFRWRLAVTVAAAALMLLNLRRGWLLSGDYAAKGIGYAAHVTHATSFAEQVRRLPGTALLISNRPELAYCYVQRGVEGLPFRFDYLNARPARDLEGMLAMLAGKVGRAPEAFLIAFPETSADCVLPEALFRHAAFVPVWDDANGRIWRRAPRPSPVVP